MKENCKVFIPGRIARRFGKTMIVAEKKWFRLFRPVLLDPAILTKEDQERIEKASFIPNSPVDVIIRGRPLRACPDPDSHQDGAHNSETI